LTKWRLPHQFQQAPGLSVPGNYILVDHALSRAERGLVGILQVEGDAKPEIFEGKVEPGSGH
jgi:nitrite reductase (NO-forming)